MVDETIASDSSFAAATTAKVGPHQIRRTG